MKTSTGLVLLASIGASGFQPPARHYLSTVPQNSAFATVASTHVEAEFGDSGEAALVVRVSGLKRDRFLASPDPVLVSLSHPKAKALPTDSVGGLLKPDAKSGFKRHGGGSHGPASFKHGRIRT